MPLQQAEGKNSRMYILNDQTTQKTKLKAKIKRQANSVMNCFKRKSITLVTKQ